MLRTVTQYGVFTFLGAAIILLLSFVVEKGIQQVDDMLVPCQHGTSYVQGKCRCDGTPFGGTYCSDCKCEHGSCSTEPTTPFSNSDYGCRCPTQSKRFGFLCDLCNTVDEECKGDCKPEFFGNKCERICHAGLSYDNNNSVCNTMRSSGGKCNTCHGHGTCHTGFCECDDNWFDDGRLQCIKTCPGSPICSGHGICKLYGNTPGCLCEKGWNGPKCDIPCPGISTVGIPCNHRGICNVDYDAKTATCECKEKFRGPDCSIECPGTVVACNGHGTCDDTGACTCQTNVKWSLPSCRCSDELTCSAKGICINEQCVCFGNNYGQHCMECKDNWHGDNCDLYCDPYLKANTSDKIEGQFGCYGHGNCDNRNGKMECTCNLDTTKRINVKGAVNDYTSFYDHKMNCGECLEEYFPKQKVVDDHGMPTDYTVPCEGSCGPATCNNKGKCNHAYGVPNELLCKCDLDHLDDASFCTECEANWYPLDFGRPNYCNKFCVTSGSLPTECDGKIDCVSCNGHGTCTDEGDCLCTGGYTGDQCQIKCTSPNGLQCAGHGICESNEIQQLMEHEFEAEGGIPLFSCTCDPQDPVDADSRIDWDEKLALGLVNGTLDSPPNPEYFGETCDYQCVKPPWEASDECNGMGNCSVVTVRTPNDGHITCKTDVDCQTTQIQQIVSGDASWSSYKGPFCHKEDDIKGCDKSTDDCYEILLKQRPRKMRSEVCASNATCLTSLDAEDWHQYCQNIKIKRQPTLFNNCKSVASFCPAKSIPTFCKTHVALTDGRDVSYKLDLAYEYDKRQYPFLITEGYRTNESVIKHDEAEAAFKSVNVSMKLPAAFCTKHGSRYPTINKVRENKQYLCNGVIVNTTNCSGVLSESHNNFYTPFTVNCLNSKESFKTYEDAVLNRGTNCKIEELDKEEAFINIGGERHIDAVCDDIKSKFPTCTYPQPCDFNPCMRGYTCVNDGKAICSTTGNMNSTCSKGISERISYNSYSCNITIPDATCPRTNTFNTDVAKHCLDNNPIVSHVQAIGDNETKSLTGAQYIHLRFKASDAISTSTRLEFGDSIIVYIRLGQIQVNEVESLQSCPITNQQCNDIWAYKADIWYHLELEINSTHVIMTRKDTGSSITRALLSNGIITNVTTIPGSSVTEYKEIVSENDISSPYSCSYETCDLGVSYREICSDIIRNVEYPALLTPNHNVLQVCSTLHDRVQLPINENYQITSEIYGLDWDAYCDFYIDLVSPIVVDYTDLENYPECKEFVDPLDGKTCIDNALDFNWALSCAQLNDALIPGAIKSSCPNTCYNHLLSLEDDFCSDRVEIFSTGNTVIDTCSTDWYDYCLKDSKGTLDGKCSAVECSCDTEKYEGISGDSCELHCALAFDGTACAEGSNMGKCVYTASQKNIVTNGGQFDPIWAIEGECQCFLSEGTRNCDIKCNGCNNETYGGEFVEVSSGVPDLSVSESECQNFGNTIGESWGGSITDANEPSGCFRDPNSKIYYNIDLNLHSCNYGGAHCIQKTPKGQIGICDNARGVCDCLPPFTTIDSTTTEDWRGQNITLIERAYNDGGATGSDLYRIRLMQGKESYIKNSLQKLDVPDKILEFTVSGTDHFVINGQNDPQLNLCRNYPYTATLHAPTPTGLETHALQITEEEHCTNRGCDSGQWVIIPDINMFTILHQDSRELKFKTSGVYYYYGLSYSNMVGKIVVSNCLGTNVYNGTQEWEDIYKDFLNNIEEYWCYDQACKGSDITLLGNLAGGSSRYNYNCNSICPGTVYGTKLPCTSNGYCGVTGDCICDTANVVVGTTSEGLIEKFQIIPGIEITNTKYTVSKLDKTGYRGDDCSIICPGFDPVLADMSTICNGHGSCDLAGACACQMGYIGNECQYKCPLSVGTNNLCNGHGTCELAEIEIVQEMFQGTSKTCTDTATMDMCNGYAILYKKNSINVAGLELNNGYKACDKINVKQCEKWAEYEEAWYTNRAPFSFSDSSKPSGCIVEGISVGFNTADTDVQCAGDKMCICQENIPDVAYCSIDYNDLIIHTNGPGSYKSKVGRIDVNSLILLTGTTFEAAKTYCDGNEGCNAVMSEPPGGTTHFNAYGRSASYNIQVGYGEPYTYLAQIWCSDSVLKYTYPSGTTFNEMKTGCSAICRSAEGCEYFQIYPADLRCYTSNGCSSTSGSSWYKYKLNTLVASNQYTRYIKNPEILCVKPEALLSDAKTNPPVQKAIWEYNDMCSEKQVQGTCSKVATLEECSRYRGDFAAIVTSGTPDLSVSEVECQAYGGWSGSGSWSFLPKGCVTSSTTSTTHYNTHVTSYQCGTSGGGAAYNCVQNTVVVESRTDRPTGCYTDGGVYTYNSAAGVSCSQNYVCQCATDKYQDSLSERCKSVTEKPMIEIEFFQDRGTTEELSIKLDCELSSNTLVICAQCACFADYVYGQWAGYECETCAIGHGKSQCREKCPGFDGAKNSMCDGKGECLFGSKISGVERVFQEAKCICGENKQIQQRVSDVSTISTSYPTNPVVDYFFFTPYFSPPAPDDSADVGTTRTVAEEYCTAASNVNLASLNGYCFGVFRRRKEDGTLFNNWVLHMGFIGKQFYTYGEYVEKTLIAGTTTGYSVKSLELFQGLNDLSTQQPCLDDFSVIIKGEDTCNHYSDQSMSCDACQTGWTGKNCRSLCQKCLLGGSCDEKPSETEGAKCVCTEGGLLWEHQCCPVGFRVADLLSWQSRPQTEVDQIRLLSSYDIYTSNELDAAYHCKKCPGVTNSDWMEGNALYKACSGPNRGKCENMGGVALSCACSINENTGKTWEGRACACDDSISTPYSSNVVIAESSDYGCAIPTGGSGKCPTNVAGDRFTYYPMSNNKVSYATWTWGPDVYEPNFKAGTAVEIAVSNNVIMWMSQYGIPGVQNGRGPCNSNSDCSGDLQCFIRNSGEQKEGYNTEYIAVNFNFCFEPQMGLMGCTPSKYDVDSADGKVQKYAQYWDTATSTFKLPTLGNFVPMYKDAEQNYVLHKRQYPCPKGTFGIQNGGNTGYGTWGTGENKCAFCPPSTFNAQEGLVGTLINTVGPWVMNNINHNCQACPTGKVGYQRGQSSDINCMNCGSGQTSVNGVCEYCACGKYELNGECLSCASGKYSYSGISSTPGCSSCASGEQITSSCRNPSDPVPCEACSTGKKEVNDVCVSCDAGQYQDQTRQQTCKNCGVGKYSSSPGWSSCYTCGIGGYHGAGVPNYYGLYVGNSADRTKCTYCGKGHYWWISGCSTCFQYTDTCRACSAGTYNHLTYRYHTCFSCTGCYSSNAGSESCNIPGSTYAAWEISGKECVGWYSPEYHIGSYSSANACAVACHNHAASIKGILWKSSTCWCEWNGGKQCVDACEYHSNSGYNMYSIVSCPGVSGGRAWGTSRSGYNCRI